MGDKKKSFLKSYLDRCSYLHYYKHCRLDDRMILLESQQGGEFGGNIYYLLKELKSDPAYRPFRIYLSVKDSKLGEAKAFYAGKKMSGIHFVETGSRAYFKAIATAKFLINDNTFLPFFIKKEGQIYLNTWHGTPLKTLGRQIHNDMHNIGNAQKNFVAADYLLYPNEYTMQHMVEDYMLENLSKAKVLLEGYPRNAAFFDDASRRAIRSRYALDGRQVVAYMPTWRGTLGEQNTSILQSNLEYIFEELDSRLPSDYVVYVNLHPIERAQVDFSAYKNVKPFPAEYETYEFLNAADMLVTDYSSVFFDFLNTGRKIILYAYDKASYLHDRGLYRPLESFPFACVETMRDLIAAILAPKSYDDSELRREFCSYDGPDAAKRLCRRVILNEDVPMRTESIRDNGKENVFIFCGQLANNGITASLKNLVRSLDRSKRNYYLFFSCGAVRKYLDTLQIFAQILPYYGTKGKMNLTLWQRFVWLAYRFKLLSTDKYMALLHDAYACELRRVFGDMRLDAIVQFTGYSYKFTNLISQFPGRKVIYVHADMQKEIELKKKQRADVLRYAYRHYDKVAVVTQDTIRSTAGISGRTDNIVVCKNVIDYKRVLENAQLPVEVLPQTIVYPNETFMQSFFAQNCKRFINVGRFSPEKGQMRLLDAFACVHRENPDTQLVIIGGQSYGDYFDQIKAHVRELDLGGAVLLMQNVPNPFPFEKQCDYFVLSSFYEGFGLVVAEADILDIPVVSVDIPGPRGFIQANGGTMVENSEEGLYQGMCALLRGEIRPMHVDYAAYNAQALREFESLFS